MPLGLFGEDNVAYGYKRYAVVAVTSNATVTPVAELTHVLEEEKLAYAELFIGAYDQADMNPSAFVIVEAAFRRRAGGTILRTQTVKTTSIFSNFGAPQPAADLLANTGPNTISVTITGKAGITIRWYLELLVKYTR